VSLADTDGDGTPDFRDPDDNNDGLPDRDEAAAGSNPKDPDTDTDNVGATDGDEVIAGTEPTDNTSLFIITDVSAVSSNVVLRWSSVSNRTYSLWG
jgi:hypothetical protein